MRVKSRGSSGSPRDSAGIRNQRSASPVGRQAGTRAKGPCHSGLERDAGSNRNRMQSSHRAPAATATKAARAARGEQQQPQPQQPQQSHDQTQASEADDMDLPMIRKDTYGFTGTACDSASPRDAGNVCDHMPTPPAAGAMLYSGQPASEMQSSAVQALPKLADHSSPRGILARRRSCPTQVTRAGRCQRFKVFRDFQAPQSGRPWPLRAYMEMLQVRLTMVSCPTPQSDHK